ncbi:ABATE domain-containing protein [Frankia sp. AiPs1]|uniref:CGNR zinc finger domain-containing protein n=1 Tax=Frankia sp. AiPs1 TaxID=573493 RepID=UPI002042FEE9|nr:ABATE domain-containing protein [Frankia sp. AiPs1]MCM3920397.1 ABATE domain-containing protein [Frankia sp. AiPs1]
MSTSVAAEPAPMRTSGRPKPVDTGSLCLDLVATRTPGGPDLLATAADTTAWLDAFDLPTPAAGLTSRDLDRVQVLRAAVDRLVQARLAGAGPDPEDAGHLNACAAPPTPTFFLRGDAWARVEVPQPDLAGVLSVLARDAIHLLTTSEPSRLRSCEGCGLAFYDRSPSGARRWCSMKRCGERTASANYRRRHADADASRVPAGPPIPAPTTHAPTTPASAAPASTAPAP